MNSEQQTQTADVSTAILQLNLEEMTEHFRSKGALWPSTAALRSDQKQSSQIQESPDGPSFPTTRITRNS